MDYIHSTPPVVDIWDSLGAFTSDECLEYEEKNVAPFHPTLLQQHFLEIQSVPLRPSNEGEVDPHSDTDNEQQLQTKSKRKHSAVDKIDTKQEPSARASDTCKRRKYQPSKIGSSSFLLKPVQIARQSGLYKGLNTKMLKIVIPSSTLPQNGIIQEVTMELLHSMCFLLDNS